MASPEGRLEAAVSRHARAAGPGRGGRKKHVETRRDRRAAGRRSGAYSNGCILASTAEGKLLDLAADLPAASIAKLGPLVFQ